MVAPPPTRPSAPNNLNAIFTQALTAHHAGQLDVAAALYKKILAVNKTQFDTLHMLGVLEGQRGNLAGGARLIEKAIKTNPKSAEAYLNLGRLQGELEQLVEAEKNLRKALNIEPNSALTYCNLSAVLDRLDRPAEALDVADRALTLAPADARANFNRANALYSLRRYKEANVMYRQILAADERNADAWLRLAKTQVKLNWVNDALASFEQAARIAPALPSLGLSFGQLLSTMFRYDEALEAFDQELVVRPKSVLTWYARGDVLRVMKRHDEAISSYDTALRLDPKFICVMGSRLLTKLEIYDWKDIGSELDEMLRRIKKNQPVTNELGVARLNTTSAEQLAFVKARLKASFAQFVTLPDREPPQPADRIKVAYISSDFGNHPVAQLLIGALEHHDKSKFEIVIVATATYQAPMFTRVQNAADNFIDATQIDDETLAGKLRDMNVQIAIDLNGYTLGNRPAVFANRAAPVQINYLGYPGTTGAEFMDYIIADRTVITEADERFYTERIAFMPDSFMPADSGRAIEEGTVSRESMGLPEGAFVFASFNDPFKITPPLFNVWMSILKQIKGSVLWLRTSAESGMNNIKREAVARGVDAERLIFASWVKSNPAHLQRLGLADLFLDTLPYNAHATANEALWAGLPVLTCLGETFAGRVAASQLKAIGLPELVTTSLTDYEAQALKLARDPNLLASIKARLAANRVTHPLFDTARYTQHLEQAYTIMWERALRGEAPVSFAVKAD